MMNSSIAITTCLCVHLVWRPVSFPNCKCENSLKNRCWSLRKMTSSRRGREQFHSVNRVVYKLSQRSPRQSRRPVRPQRSCSYRPRRPRQSSWARACRVFRPDWLSANKLFILRNHHFSMNTPTLS